MLKILLNEKFMLGVVMFNVLVVFLQESGLAYPLLSLVDVVCTFIFVVEMVAKHRVFGFKDYWRDGWNALDGVVTLIALPSVVAYFVPSMSNYGFVVAFRAFRVFKLFRSFKHFFGVKQIWEGFKLAMQRSASFLIGYVVAIVLFAIVNCAMFAGSAPEYFATPLESVYSIFQLFTIEGWYEIPNAVVGDMSPVWVHLVRAYFCVLLIGGGIIGMSLINSIFVDSLAADNNDDVKSMLDDIKKNMNDNHRQLEEKIAELQEEIEKVKGER